MGRIGRLLPAIVSLFLTPPVFAQCEWSDATAFPGTNGTVRALTTFDDGTGEALYAGGDFTLAGGVGADRVARWDGSAWTALGAGVDGPVYALTVHDDGTGAALYAGGSFASAGGVPAANVARWDGSNWSAVGSGTGSLATALASFDGLLWVGEQFPPYLTSWDPQTGWSSFPATLSGPVFALSVPSAFDAALHVGGFTSLFEDLDTQYIFRWDGNAYSGLQSGTQSSVYAIAAYNDGLGHDLYAGGAFGVAGAYTVQQGGVAVNNLGRWDGTGWSAVGTPPNDGVNARLTTLAVFTEFDGDALFPPALFAGGEFTTAGGVPANHMARWDGTTWSALGSGMNDDVLALQVFDDGDGPALYAGGAFTTAGGNAAPYIARWGCPAAVGVEPGESPARPVFFSSQPNPFASRVELVIRGSRGTPGSIEIFDVTGRMVRALATSALTPSGGAHTLVWDGHDQQGQQLGAGVYFVRLRWDASEITRKIVRTR